jgi:hypothetical protein
MGGSIRARTTLSPMSGGEFNGGYIRFKGVLVKYDTSSTSDTLFRFRDSTLTALIENDFSVEIEDITIQSSTTLAGLVTVFVNAAATIKSWWQVRNITMNTDFVGVQRVVSASLSGTGVRPESIVVENIDVDSSAVQDWVRLTGGSFTGCRVTSPATHFRNSFTINAAANVSASQTFTHPRYAAVPQITMSTTGSTIDATGDFVGVVESAARTTTVATISTVTSSGANATANMVTEVIAVARMDNYILP